MRRSLLILSLLLLIPVLAFANTIGSGTMEFEGILTDAGGGVFTGTIPATAGSWYVPGGGGAGISTAGGFDVYARQGATAYYDDIAQGTIGADHDAYSSGGGWGAWYDPDVPDWNNYELVLTGTNWYLRFIGTAGGTPMSGVMDWSDLYASENETGAYVNYTGTDPDANDGGAAALLGCTGEPQCGAGYWDMDWTWGSEAIPLELAGFDVEVTLVGGSTYHVTMTPADPDEVWVDDDYTSATPGWNATHFAVIQDAVDGVISGGTVNVAAGTYREQLTIARNLTLTGAGMDQTYIEAVDSGSAVPTTVTSWESSVVDINPCILAIGVSSIDIGELTVDGRQVGGERFYGIYLQNSSGSVHHCRITDILDAASPGAQRVASLVAGHDDLGGSYSVEFSDNTIPEFQKGGILIMGPGLDCLINDNSVVNAPSEFNAGNGIQVSYGATGELNGNTVQGIGYTGEDWSATGILLFEAGSVAINGGEVFNCQTGISYSGWGWRYLPPTTPQITIDGVHGHDNDWNASFHVADDGVNLDVDIENCIFEDNLVGTDFWASGAYGSYYDGWANATLNVNILDNIMVNNQYGLYGNNGCLEVNTAVNLDAHGNDLEGCVEYGVLNTFANDEFDATDNWWGDATGPNLITPPPAPRGPRPVVQPYGIDTAAQPAVPGEETGMAINGDRGFGVNVSPYVNFFPWQGTAAIDLLPATSGPINCSQVSTLAFHYTPDLLTPALRGYEITVGCSMAELDFDETDITDSGVLSSLGTSHFFRVIDNLDGTYTISDAILGTTPGLDYAADLFSIDIHGLATGTGTVEILHCKLRDLDNGDIFATLATADIEVDCTAPSIPTMTAEPVYTQGTDNTVYWSDEGGTGAVEYLVQRAQDPGFSLDIEDSTWFSGLNHTFSTLTDNQIYYYRVMSRDALANASGWSAAVFSTQDDTAPVSAVDPLAAYQNTLTFNVPYTASDVTSGIGGVELFYDINASGSWASFGIFTSSPISFTAAGEGTYTFYTVATDNVGNIEAAPASADATTIVDITDPAGTFVINNGDVYTNSINVMLYSSVTDGNPPVQMRFSEDNVSFSPWTAYSAITAFILTVSADGPYTVYAQFMDAAENVLALQDDIIYDSQAPGIVADMAAETGHEKVAVTWTDPPDADLGFLVIYRGVWHDGTGVSAYPEYDDLGGITVPTRPATRAAAEASSEWTGVGVVPAGTEIFEDAFAPRGRYYYEIFAIDLALNYGGPSATNADALNYWLGDVSDGTFGIYDGLVDAADITGLGAAFGTSDGESGYEPETDVGPTSDMSVLGIPQTDNVIDLEDLMMFAINYSQVAPAPAPRTGDEIAALSWIRIDDRNWALALQAPCADLKGIQVRLELPAGIVGELTAGNLMTSQAVPFFLANIDRNGLDINLALMGRGATIQGDGRLLQVTLTETVDLDIPSVTLRNSNNEDVDFAFEMTTVPDLPTIYQMAQNFPNPFNPTTSISFSLPQAQSVKLFVFGVDGRLVRTLVNGSVAAGHHSVVWDGRDETGEQVSSGVYFYRIDAGPLQKTSKMLMLK
ncbi:MAG: hypothetical protein GY835_27600 [bacterium]|nr:hypothetical protein [bacterium]